MEAQKAGVEEVGAEDEEWEGAAAPLCPHCQRTHSGLGPRSPTGLYIPALFLPVVSRCCLVAFDKCGCQRLGGRALTLCTHYLTEITSGEEQPSGDPIGDLTSVQIAQL